MYDEQYPLMYLLESMSIIQESIQKSFKDELKNIEPDPLEESHREMERDAEAEFAQKYQEEM